MTLTTGTCERSSRVENKCGIDMAFDFHILCMAMAIGMVESRYTPSVYGSNAQLRQKSKKDYSQGSYKVDTDGYQIASKLDSY